MKYVEEIPHLVQYLKGTLSPDEKNALEEKLLNTPDLREEKELIELLRTGIQITEDRRMLQSHYEKIKWRRRYFNFSLAALPLFLFFLFFLFKIKIALNHHLSLKTTTIASKILPDYTSEKNTPTFEYKMIFKEITRSSSAVTDTINARSPINNPKKNIVQTDRLNIQTTVPMGAEKSPQMNQKIISENQIKTTIDQIITEKKDTGDLHEKQLAFSDNQYLTVTVVPFNLKEGRYSPIQENDWCYREMEVQLKKHLIKTAGLHIVDYLAFTDKLFNENTAAAPLSDHSIQTQIAELANESDIFLLATLEIGREQSISARQQYYSCITLKAYDTRSGEPIAAARLESGRRYFDDCRDLINIAFSNSGKKEQLKIEGFLKEIKTRKK